jgi:hypothetical protein
VLNPYRALQHPYPTAWDKITKKAPADRDIMETFYRHYAKAIEREKLGKG